MAVVLNLTRRKVVVEIEDGGEPGVDIMYKRLSAEADEGGAQKHSNSIIRALGEPRHRTRNAQKSENRLVIHLHTSPYNSGLTFACTHNTSIFLIQVIRIGGPYISNKIESTLC